MKNHIIKIHHLMPTTIAMVTAHLPSRRLLWRVSSLKFPNPPSSGGILPVPLRYRLKAQKINILLLRFKHCSGHTDGGGHGSIVPSIMTAQEKQPLERPDLVLRGLNNELMPSSGACNSGHQRREEHLASVSTTHNNHPFRS